MIWTMKWNFKNFLVSILDARQQTIPKAFGFEAATRRGFFEDFFLAI